MTGRFLGSVIFLRRVSFQEHNDVLPIFGTEPVVIRLPTFAFFHLTLLLLVGMLLTASEQSCLFFLDLSNVYMDIDSLICETVSLLEQEKNETTQVKVVCF